MKKINFKDKTLLITGGTGSFGKAVIENFLDSDIKEIRIFSRDEKKQNDLRIKYQSDKLKFYLGDVRSYDSINRAMDSVNYVFCAAALKQVPSCEFYPMEAVKTNILGVDNTITAAVHNGVENCVVLSTDKAVSPINAMGISKALMEKIVLASSRNLGNKVTNLCITRYGNVMCSRGSVIPLFVNQIKSNKPITITDPSMTRFMMSLKDAIDLVLYAFMNSNQGDIFVQKSPACTLEVLVNALQMIFCSDLPIKILGTRHGEKKHETLLSREEFFKSKDLGDYFKVSLDNRSLNYEKYFEKGEKPLSSEVTYSSNNTTLLNVDEMVTLLKDQPYIIDQLKN